MIYNQSVLVCDDQASCRAELKMLLRTGGLNVVGEASNDDALRRFEELMPDLVIMDVTLLGTWDSMVAIKRMRQLHGDATLLVTGMPSQTEALMEALTMGAVDFFFKPFHIRSVRDCLEKNVA
jgi:two-component system chemotaxis response regulator CheY